MESYALSAYSSLEGEALAQQVDALLAASGASREQYREVAPRSAILAALDEALAQELPPPDEAAVAARYEACLLYTSNGAATRTSSRLTFQSSRTRRFIYVFPSC